MQIDQLEQYFKERLHDITLAAQNFAVSQASVKFGETFHLKDQKSRDDAWQADTEKFKVGRDDAWQADIEKFKVGLKKLKEEHDYSHIFLVAKDGDVLYSDAQEAIGKNVVTGVLKESPLASAFLKGLKGVTLQDFLPSKFLDGQQTFFFAAPVFSAGKLVAVLLISIDAAPINAIVQQRKGLGKTGEAYLVGKTNGKTAYCSDRIIKDKGKNVIGVEKRSNDIIDKAFAGQTGCEIKTGSLGEVEISSYAPLEIQDINWAIMVTISLEESLDIMLSGDEKTFFTKYIAQYDYYDLFLIHPQGRIFYTVKHESDYNTNIINGKYANSGFGQLVQEVLKTKTYQISDYAPYAPTNNEPAAFIAIPLIIDDKVEMIVALQFSDAKMNNIMQQRAGMGKTGEAYLVGSDKLMRSNSFLDPINHSIKASFANPNLGTVDTESSRAALAGETGAKIVKDYLNKPVLSAYTPLQVGNTTWALLVEINKTEAFSAITTLKWWFGITVMLCLAIIITIAILLTRSIKHPLEHLVKISNAIASGNLNNEIIISGKDETGQLLQAFSDMQTQLREHLEREINNIIQAISQGNFEERISLENKTGFFRTISESINQIVVLNQAIIEDTMRVFSALAVGDLTKSIEKENYAGVFKQLRDDANATVMRLTEIMTVILQQTENVSNAAGEISQGNLSLSQRTEEQAASLEETAASMEQMTCIVQKNADNTKTASGLADSAKEQAEKGGQVVGATIGAMNEISKSSKKITDIIGVIDEIAFQTNLLALNAAVEAARAGEHGRGFAVVASEVRSLAQRSAAAAKEIKELIQDSVVKVEEGTELANQSGENLEKIVAAVTKVSDLIGNISAANEEQSSGILQVNKAMVQMDEITQQNASLVEEVASASSAMKEQAMSLKEQVAFFNVGEAEISLHVAKNKNVTNPEINQTKITHYNDEDWKDF
ncbi:methyl-accepting chemotaxis protein [Candidatus Marithioploca araucensis]|uniref:Methyl-accepting chemotaxis protein n=1 Tax=Candidatus Marithioploca araucensis TaxID=70273 RepID=A0ABT7VRW3_9GAMM|nr:methyl-accepting chemotaxis protein [Candidatus Marithioploca araucensis]